MPGSRERRSKPELGTDTVPVELVELSNVGPTGGGFGPKALLAVGAVALTALVLVIANGRAKNPTPSPSVPAVALASAAPIAVATPSPTPRPTPFRPTAPPPTPIPTPPPPWQWTRSDLLPGLVTSVDGIWVLNGKVIALVGTYDAIAQGITSSIARLEGGDWVLAPHPPAIMSMEAGTVVDGRLWFFAQVGAVADADTTWQLISTDGGTWTSLGPAIGLPAFDGANVLARTGNTWVLVTERDEGIGSVHANISWSVDGRHWQPATVPSLLSNYMYTGAASIGDSTVLLGDNFDTLEDQHWSALRSTDGQHWARTTLPTPPGTFPRGLVCGERVCIVTIDQPDGAAAPTQQLIESKDGEHWASVEIEVPYVDESSTLSPITKTASGFIALAGAPAHALLSTDGVAWRAIDVLPPDTQDYISGLAVAGDTIVAIAPWQSSDQPNRYWLGSLAAMELAKP